MGLFKKKEKKVESQERNTFLWATNAPDHWPKIYTDNFVPSNHPASYYADLINIGAAIKSTFEKSDSGCKLNAFSRTRLTSDGILEIPLEIDDRGRLVSVFFYTEANEKSASHYFGAVNILKDRGEPSPVYYAPKPLTKTNPGNPLEEFGAHIFTEFKAELPSGNYSMWWATDTEQIFTDSFTMKNITRSYNAIAGIETYIYATLLRSLKLVEEDVGRVALPKESLTIPVEGPENQISILSASQEKGIRFHFNPNTTSEQYRKDFWYLFAQYTENWKQLAIEKDFPLDDKMEPNPRGWWNMVVKMAQKEEEGNKFHEIGTVVIQ